LETAEIEYGESPEGFAMVALWNLESQS
jgi:hypothetical protein